LLGNYQWCRAASFLLSAGSGQKNEVALAAGQDFAGPMFENVQAKLK
jgi:hypothetical protein